MVFKEKYFKSDNIMELNVKGNVSLIWRSLAATRWIINAGVVGDLTTKLT